MQSRRFLAGGVSSGLRAMSKPLPLFFTSGSGSHLTDADENDYIDYTLAWGPLILGHCNQRLNEALAAQLGTLQQVGAQHDLEWRVAERICRMAPCAERVVFSNTGTEAVQTAIRLARAYTGRTKIVRFEGHYHGWMDNVLVGYRPSRDVSTSSQLTLPTQGMNPSVLEEILLLPWNDLEIVEQTLTKHAGSVAAIITEPILCNSSCLMPKQGYLQGLRELTERFGVMLIFDEVITGFRVASGGAQELFGVTPDLATYAKAIAGGLPLSAVAGRYDIMKLVEERKVVHAGTYNGNAISLAAANATLGIIEAEGGAAALTIRNHGQMLMDGLRSLAKRAGIPVLINGVGSVFHLSFTKLSDMHAYSDTLQVDFALRDRFIEIMLEIGVYLLPDGRWYLSTAHTEEDLIFTLDAASHAFTRCW